MILQERVQTNYAGNQNIPSRAEGADLDALGELTGRSAKEEIRRSISFISCTSLHITHIFIKNNIQKTNSTIYIAVVA